ncbi:helix-turn-helix transcriptional regulator [Enterococcus thailandicus]|uniref:helix-turn-helix transcriptional regulator n=1 Tax=Enterococcus thailandicus TaxID=417368 RepID=UPI00288F0243|nr:helix-turn-helix transcriptional regulator [Enterococcus thailandicus]MDT2753156.1 helix-turn-helix transcriptional regulator [Enterococcus thailandicus]
MTKWLKEKREKLGFTQESFAKRVGIAKTTYSSYEQGHRTPSVATAQKMAELLEVPWTIFFDDEVLETYVKKEAIK